MTTTQLDNTYGQQLYICKTLEFPVCAKDLYWVLKIQGNYSEWIQKSLKDHASLEGSHYIFTMSRGKVANHYFTIPFAKKLATSQHTELGRQVREYLHTKK